MNDKSEVENLQDKIIFENEFRLIFENSPISKCIAKTNGRIILVNNLMCELLGYTKDELLNIHFENITHPDDLEKNRILWQKMLLAENESEYIEKRYLHKNGQVIYANVYLSLYKDSGGNPKYYIIQIIDFTERKFLKEKLSENEETYRALVDNTPEFIYSYDIKSCFTAVNKSLCSSLGLSSDKIIGKTHKDLGFPDENIKEWDKLHQRVLFQKEIVIEETATIMPDGSNRIYEVILTPIQDNSNCIIGIRGISRDITEKKNAENAFRKLNEDLEIIVFERTKELEILNATKDKFFSIIAHDLKNPFAGIFSSCELLLRNIHKYDTDKILDKILKINASTKQGYDLLVNLLEWSRSQTGSIEFNPVKLNLKNIVDKSIKVLEAQANNKNINIVNLTSEELSLIADVNLLQTVFRNLLTNAIKFTPDFGKIIIKSNEDESKTEISVIDTGVGINKDIRDKLFRIDTKITTSGTSNEVGTGLGLILCKEFIEIHGGKIWIESEEGKGSEFKFIIPKMNKN